MHNILVSPDSFKDSLSAKAVATHIANGITNILPEANINQIPLSDGGEGLLEALVTPLNGSFIKKNVKDPLMRDIQAQYGILDNGKTAVIEMARASGLELLKPDERNPLKTSTFGTGQLIKAALDKGCSKIIIGLGGSATNDGGMGIVKALGGKFINKQGKSIGEGGAALADLYRIDLSDLDQRILNCEIISACDVSNPFCGPNGASMVFGAQKGGSPQDLQQLDKNLLHYASVIQSDLGKDIKNVEGTGAAGGTGIGLLTFLDAELKPGIDLIMDELQMEKHTKEADIVITGEGQIDQQTLNGKTITGVAKMAKKHEIPVIAIAGKADRDIDELYNIGITAVFSIVNQPLSLQKSIKSTDQLIQSCVENIFRLLDSGLFRNK